jgi:hypothetical protein
MDEHTKRNALIVGAVVLALLSIGAGALIALTSNDDRAQTTNPSPSSTPSQTSEPSGSSEPSASGTPEPSASASPVLQDGRHFVYVKTASQRAGSTRVRFDLAYFFTGAKAEAAAADHGDEVVDGYYIVNDNPRLRTLPLADEVTVEYVPESNCCELQPWKIDDWLEAIGLSTNPSDYPGRNVPWWFTVEGGQITRIEQQYLP